jgi:hypothetical protein
MLVAMAVTDRKSLRPWVTGFAGCFADTAALDRLCRHSGACPNELRTVTLEALLCEDPR